MSLSIVATTHRILHDLLQVLSKQDKEPFEVGCRCKSPEIQDNLYQILSMVVSGIADIVVEKKPEDYIVCVKRPDVPVSEEVDDTQKTKGQMAWEV